MMLVRVQKLSSKSFSVHVISSVNTLVSDLEFIGLVYYIKQ